VVIEERRDAESDGSALRTPPPVMKGMKYQAFVRTICRNE
jgi:hypothetical protein